MRLGPLVEALDAHVRAVTPVATTPPLSEEERADVEAMIADPQMLEVGIGGRLLQGLLATIRAHEAEIARLDAAHRWRETVRDAADGAVGDSKSPLDVVTIRARAEAATPRPWVHGGADHEAWARTGISARVLGGGDNRRIAGVQGLNDASFIAHARADVPSLCDEVERERKVSAAWKVLAHARKRAMADMGYGDDAGWDEAEVAALRALGVDPDAKV